MDDAIQAVDPPAADVAELLGEILELPREARAARLEQACAATPSLCAEVQSLLEWAAPGEAFFQRLSERICSLPPQVAEDRAHSQSPSAPPDGLTAGVEVGRYRILDFVGAGGMGTVYRAYDDRLDRDVALKLLPTHLTTDPAARDRFLAEARAAAALDHPNVCTVHEVGETARGDLFIAMALYEGETLAARLSRGALPIDEALDYARQLARGLAAAHARGIVHQDVKPGNVLLLEDGTAKLLDFGLARMGESALAWGGLAGGTIPYMSPEQLRGRPADHRADLWSLGVVLYEMLAGERPFGGERFAHAILHEEPRALGERRPEVPASLDSIIERLLRKDPSERFADARELLAELETLEIDTEAGGYEQRGLRSRRLGVATLALFVAAATAVSAWYIAGEASPESPPASSERVLVADFAHDTSNPGLADAVSQALREHLASSPGLQVPDDAAVASTLQRMLRPTGSALHGEVAREVAMREGIRALVDGELRRGASGYTVTARIVEAQTGKVVARWQETVVDSSLALEAIGRLAGVIGERLRDALPTLPGGEELYQRTTSSLDALRAYSDGNRAFFSGDYARAADLYDDAVRLDSTFSAAHTMVAYTIGRLTGSRGRTLEAHIRAYRFSAGLTPAERFIAEGNYYQHVLGDLPRGVEAFRLHVEAAKVVGDVVQYATLANALARMGNMAAAERVSREGTQVYPTAFNQMSLVRVLYRQGKRDDALSIIAFTDSLLPGHPLTIRTRALVAAASGDYAAADSLARLIPASAGAVVGPRLLALLAAVQGHVREAIDRLATVRDALVATGHAEAAVEIALAIARLHRSRGGTTLAEAELTEFLGLHPLAKLHPLDRPYLSLARYYAAAAEPRRAREFLRAYERETPAEYRGPERWAHLLASAETRLAEGDAVGALADLTDATRAYPGSPAFEDTHLLAQERPEFARAYAAAGLADSAIAVYERYLAAPSLHRIEIDAFELPDALLRLAELSESSGRTAEAAALYRRFAERWRYADPELQPRVASAVANAARLAP